MLCGKFWIKIRGYCLSIFRDIAAFCLHQFHNILSMMKYNQENIFIQLLFRNGTVDLINRMLDIYNLLMLMEHSYIQKYDPDSMMVKKAKDYCVHLWTFKQETFMKTNLAQTDHSDCVSNA